MPSIFPFDTTTTTKKVKSRTTRVSRGELEHETSISSTEHYTGSVSKGTEGTSTEAAGNSTQEDEAQYVTANNVIIRLSNWRKKFLN